MAEYKLYYFAGRGLGEITRQMFHMAGQPFEDVRLTHETWPAMKEKFPFAQVPVLEVDGVQIPQSLAIARFVAKRLGYYGKTDVEQALVDALADQYKDFYVAIKDYYYYGLGIMEQTPEFVENARKTVLIPNRDKFFAILTKYIKESKTGFLGGGDVSFADLILAEHVSTIQRIFPEYADDFPEIKAHLAKVHGIPELAKWLAARPVTPF